MGHWARIGLSYRPKCSYQVGLQVLLSSVLLKGIDRSLRFFDIEMVVKDMIN